MSIPERRYASLETISRIFRILAWVVAIVGGLSVVGGSFGLTAQGRSGEAFFFLIIGGLAVALYALLLLAASEGIKLMIGLEQNTRLTANALLGGARPPAPPSYPPPPGS